LCGFDSRHPLIKKPLLIKGFFITVSQSARPVPAFQQPLQVKSLTIQDEIMSHTVKLSEAQIRTALSNGEFGDDVIKSTKNVAVIMSQSWCPQWLMLNLWLKTLPKESDIHIYTTVYDQELYYEEFMAFKETVFKNWEIPYIRYYIDGKCIKETNYTSRGFFLNVFKV
jgi:hypothetical protein